MLLQWFKKKYVFIAVILFALVSYSQEAKEESGEKPVEEADKAIVKEEKKKSTDNDWAKQATVLNTHEGRIKVYKSKIEELILQKQKTKIKAEKQQIISEMIQAHLELRRETTSYNEIYNKIRYRFPQKGKGSYARRRYLPMRVESLERMENSHGLDALLTRTRLLINQKYKPYIEEKIKATEDDIAKKKKKGYDIEEKKGLKLER